MPRSGGGLAFAGDDGVAGGKLGTGGWVAGQSEWMHVYLGSMQAWGRAVGGQPVVSRGGIKARLIADKGKDVLVENEPFSSRNSV